MLAAIGVMRELYDNPYRAIPPNSLLQLISEREYLKDPVWRLVESLVRVVSHAISSMFRKTAPSNEADLNQKIHGLLQGHRDDLRSEHPAVSFACARVVPDHTLVDANILIEAKYIRGDTRPSSASEGIAADLIKYPETAHILFIVYDPERAIADDSVFKKDFEAKGGCTISIIR